ncbi:MAG: RsmB/NOP family class I SAM-dependent RNA methyltransferase [Promethearchaeota archaeon]
MIQGFINGETSSIPLKIRKNSEIVHYYNEIVRFWNKLNFIIKTSLKDSESLEINQYPKYLYATFKILWEHTSEKNILNELKDIDRKFLKRIRTFSWDKALIHKKQEEKLSILTATPSFMIDRLHMVMNLEFLKTNIEFMNGLNNIEITVRINNLPDKSKLQNLLPHIREALKQDKIDSNEDINIPELLWISISQKNKVIKNHLYQKGILIFQDKASAAVIQVLSPKQEEKVCDMCAAPGIKTSLIAQHMNNKGYIIAGEFLPKRAGMMRILLNKLKVSNVHILNTDSIVFPIRFQEYFDCILLDAPCTGSGAFLTTPELKWRQNRGFLRQNTVLQKKLFENALKLLKPNGVLVYSTCSLYPEEGEYQILEFIEHLEPMDLPKWFSPSYKINDKFIQGTGRLFPSIHHTQGFFIGKFKKKV